MKNKEIEKLIYLFSKLPGFGTRSARRIVLHLLQDRDIRLKELIKGLIHASENIVNCIECNNIDCSTICTICSNQNRINTIIAIVETVADLWSLERSNIFKGKYHILGGSLSTSDLITPTKLGLDKLLLRCKRDKVEELVIATNSTIESQTTAYFITEYFKNESVKISRLASGIPIGGELDYLDEGTLSAAFEGRKLF